VTHAPRVIPGERCELLVHSETGMLLSDAARRAYLESGGSLDAALAASEEAHLCQGLLEYRVGCSVKFAL
jgi:hypothetical protein